MERKACSFFVNYKVFVSLHFFVFLFSCLILLSLVFPKWILTNSCKSERFVCLLVMQWLISFSVVMYASVSLFFSLAYTFLSLFLPMWNHCFCGNVKKMSVLVYFFSFPKATYCFGFTCMLRCGNISINFHSKVLVSLKSFVCVCVCMRMCMCVWTLKFSPWN